MPKLISLTQGHFAIVDEADYADLAKHRWYAVRYKKNSVPVTYAARKVRVGEKRTILFMHQAIMNPPDGMLVDHRDSDGLNCQRSNMRIVSHSQNGMNRRRDARNTSGASGVTLHKGTGKWKASIGINGENKHLGYFNSFEEAVSVRHAAEKEHYREYANTAASTPSESRIATNAIIANELQNQPRQLDRRSVSGVTGVSLNRQTGRWQASIFKNGKRHHLGWHDTIEAAAARKTAEQQLK